MRQERLGVTRVRHVPSQGGGRGPSVPEFWDLLLARAQYVERQPILHGEVIKLDVRKIFTW